jgi:2Fe-2S ferredoxin
MKTVTIHVADDFGKERVVEGIVGWQLMEVLRDAGMKIPAECGGACACATCHVYVDEEWLEKLPVPTADEKLMLDDAMSPEDNSRLSCQIILSEALDGLKVTIAPNP